MNSEPQKDTRRVKRAAKAFVDRRSPVNDSSSVLVTLDHLVATVLLTTQEGDIRRALGMLHEGLVPSVEERLAQFEKKKRPL